ncbi:hypothetical protein RclHR1_01450019 [Rhizophagus clarus]|uniref:Protein kinase domain-containing protein n=1 Tax=Rhizophagus clarus TaxID=94130 RepID=A0A2Z6QTC6_9GLOM|nr:hypothetical protein RclHR1_01450019 [Rhizophagus clarus]
MLLEHLENIDKECDEAIFERCKSRQIIYLKENWTNCNSRNEKIDDLIRDMRLKIDIFDDIIFEWVSYDQFYDIKEISKVDIATAVYSATWKDGPLYYDINEKIYKRRQVNKKVNLKCLDNSQDITYEFLNEKLTNIVDKLIEWIPFDQFDNIKEIGKDGLATIYSAIWKGSSSYYNEDEKIYKKNNVDQTTKVTLKCLYNSYIVTNEFLYEVKLLGFVTNLYGISQNPRKFFKLDKWKCYFIQEMPLKIKSDYSIIFEWIPFNQFDNIKEIKKGDFDTVYTAIWKDGPLHKKHNVTQEKASLKYLYYSQNITNEFLNEIKSYSNNEFSGNVLPVFGISQNLDTNDYVMVLYYAKGRDFCNWLNKNKNHKEFNWHSKTKLLKDIIKGLYDIHQKNMVHRDFHTRNILAKTTNLESAIGVLIISDMGLCGKVDNLDKTKVYGVMPYVAPEVLRGNPYTQAADIYSFAMIMYFVATGKQPFANCAHDEYLVLDICSGIRPGINEMEAPNCYTDLMKRCWDSNSNNRPNITEIKGLFDLFELSTDEFHDQYGDECFVDYDEDDMKL